MEQVCIPETQTGKTLSGTKPAKVFRQGACSACVFFNAVNRNGEIVELPTVSFARLYRQNGQLKKSTSLGRDDLTAAIIVLGQAYTWLKELEKEMKGGMEDED